MEERQLINSARPSRVSSTTPSHCTPFTLPSNGVLTLGASSVITLTSDAVFRPECTAGANDIILTGSSSPSYTDFRDPFYASTIPECYALAAATVIAYMLVIMLVITPRSFLHEGAVVLGRRGFTNGPSGSDGIGIGGRPWLQKVAALTVAVSLTIATADTFKVAERQYEIGYMDAQQLQKEVEDGMELKVIRVISDTFLWLAQAQTLIRLFPRQREKIIIKWTAFALISLDVLFSILNNFVYKGNSRPQSFVDAVPALAYLFQLALSLLYAAWVLYYGITKKQYAFYHVQMKNMCLVALLSIVAVLVPVVFFVLDISKPTLAGWGDYVRWVGAAAASVVVWEWVERIEALERDEKKDGVLGREVFDGDEMLDASDTSSTWKYRSKGSTDGSRGKGGDEGGGGVATGTSRLRWPAVAGLANRYRPQATPDVETGKTTDTSRRKSKRLPRTRPPLWPTRPPPAATPVSRTDTASAESTVYAIRYHPISEATPSINQNAVPPQVSRHNSMDITVAQSANDVAVSEVEKPVAMEQMEEEHESTSASLRPNAWQALAKAMPFKRRAHDPPAEVSAITAKAPEAVNTHTATNKWDVRARLEDFAATQAEKLAQKAKGTENIGPLPVTVIPAPPRRRNLEMTLEELEDAERGQRPAAAITVPWPSSPATLARNHLTTGDSESTRILQPQRLSDPYTPDDLNAHAVHQRGAISFLTSSPHNQYGSEVVSPVSPMSPIGVTRLTPTIITRSSSTHTRAPSTPRRDGLPTISIPAPPRRPRPSEDD